MQIKIFTIPIGDSEIPEKEVNAFLRGHRVLEVVHEFVADGSDSRWCLLVKTMDAVEGQRHGGRRQDRIDYKNVLDEASFARFCMLRKARKIVSEKEGLPAFAVLTDRQMAELARFETLTADSMKQVVGIGEAKAEKFGPPLLKALDGLDATDADSAGAEYGGRSP